jgi:hypothetical protein
MTETTAVYAAQLGLWCLAVWRVGCRPSVLALAAAMTASWLVGNALHGTDRDVANALLDLGTILAIRATSCGARDRQVCAIALALIVWRCVYMAGPYIDHYPFAVVVNCAVALQLIVAGGMMDGAGRRIDRWVHRLPDRGARAIRYVAY